MRDAQPSTIYLSDYRQPDFLIDTTQLHFLLGEERTRVTATLALRRNPDAGTDRFGPTHPTAPDRHTPSSPPGQA